MSGYFFHWEQTKDKTGSDTTQVPAAAMKVDIYRRGAIVRTGGSFGIGVNAVEVEDVGDFVVGDNVVRLDLEAQTVLGTVDSITDEDTIVINFSSGAVLAAGHLLASTENRPDYFKSPRAGSGREGLVHGTRDSQGSATTSAAGIVSGWVDQQAVWVATSGGGTTYTAYPGVGAHPTIEQKSPVLDSATAVAHILDTERAYTTAGALLQSIRNAGVEKFSIDKDGKIQAFGGFGGIVTFDGNVTFDGVNNFFNSALTMVTGDIVVTDDNEVVLDLMTILNRQKLDFDFSNSRMTSLENFDRLHKRGTQLVTGDFGSLTGWGTSPSVSNVDTDSVDHSGKVTITSGTGSPSANPTFVLTFKDGAFGNVVPHGLVALVATDDSRGLAALGPAVTTNITATTMTIRLTDTPEASKTYTFDWIIL